MSFLLNYLGLLSILVERLPMLAPTKVVFLVMVAPWWTQQPLCYGFLPVIVLFHCIVPYYFLIVYVYWTVNTQAFSISKNGLSLLIYINFTA